MAIFLDNSCGQSINVYNANLLILNLCFGYVYWKTRESLHLTRSKWTVHICSKYETLDKIGQIELSGVCIYIYIYLSIYITHACKRMRIHNALTLSSLFPLPALWNSLICLEEGLLEPCQLVLFFHQLSVSIAPNPA